MAMQIQLIAQDCRDYAIKYKCTLGEALIDWEGDGGNGSFGLNRDDEYEVAKVLGIESEFGTNNEY